MKQYPNLYLLGAAKCGTTSLHNYLSQHPDICMSIPKEPFFFEVEYERGLDFYMEKYFRHYSGQSVIGDGRHRHLYLPFVLPRIKENAPSDAKFLVIVRHPVDRAYSHWWHFYSRGIENKLFVEAIDDNIKRIQEGPHFVSEQDALLYKKSFDWNDGFSPYRSYVDSGFYAEQIQRYIDSFGSDRIKILFLSDLISDPDSVMASIFEFIGVSSDLQIKFTTNNVSLSAMGVTIFNMLKNIPGRKIFPKFLRTALSDRIQRTFSASKKGSLMPTDLRKRLISIYEPYTLKLEHMTGRLLEGWRE